MIIRYNNDMMRKFILFTVLTVCSLGIMAQVVPTVKMVPLKQNGKYGFKMNGKTVIPVQYDTVTCFYPCRLAIVKKGDKEFAIDVNGKKVSQDFAKLTYYKDECMFECKLAGNEYFSLYDIDFEPVTPEGKCFSQMLNNNIIVVEQGNHVVDFMTLEGEKILSIMADKIDVFETPILINGHTVVGELGMTWMDDDRLKYKRKYNLTHLSALFNCGIVAKMGNQTAYFDFEGNNLSGYFDYNYNALFKAKKKYYGAVVKKAALADKYVYDNCDMWAFRRKQILKAEQLYPLYPDAFKDKILVPDNALYSDLVSHIFPFWLRMEQNPSEAEQIFNEGGDVTGDVSSTVNETIKAFDSFNMKTLSNGIRSNVVFQHMTDYCYTMPDVYGELINAKGMLVEGNGAIATAARFYEVAISYGCKDAEMNLGQLIKNYKARKREAFFEKFSMITSTLTQVANAYIEAASGANEGGESASSPASLSMSKNKKSGSSSNHGKDCRICLGTGNCQQCYGSGVVVFQSYRRVCDTCNGNAGKCHSCKGSGKK